MKVRILFFTVLLSIFGLSVPVMAPAAQSQQAPAKTSPMPAERAKATFEDERVKTFMAVVEKDFGGKCLIPDNTKTEAILTQIGSGDFSSSFYKLTIACPRNNGLSEVQLTVEFSPPLGIPLNLALSLHYKK